MPKHFLYEKFEEPARTAKIASQMVIGLVISIFLVLKLGFHVFQVSCPWSIVQFLIDNDVLKIVGIGLGFSAAVELAGMLFTDGPDEAVEPVIHGLASAILITVSHHGDVRWEAALFVLASGAIIGLLFYVRSQYLKERGP